MVLPAHSESVNCINQTLNGCEKTVAELPVSILFFDEPNPCYFAPGLSNRRQGEIEFTYQKIYGANFLVRVVSDGEKDGHKSGSEMFRTLVRENDICELEWISDPVYSARICLDFV